MVAWQRIGSGADSEGNWLCRYVVQTYVRPEIVFTHAEGARMYDAHGKEYLDFAAGIAVNALGLPFPPSSPIAFLAISHFKILTR